MSDDNLQPGTVEWESRRAELLDTENDLLRTRLAEVEAENGRLRGVLTEIYADADNHWALQQPRSVVAKIKERARAALAQTKEPSDDG